jgi:hypothetical protein
MVLYLLLPSTMQRATCARACVLKLLYRHDAARRFSLGGIHWVPTGPLAIIFASHREPLVPLFHPRAREHPFVGAQIGVDRDPTAWERYRWQMVAIATVLLVQMLLIVGLFYERRRRRYAETAPR